MKVNLSLLLLFSSMISNAKSSNPCNAKKFSSNSFVCVCNSTYCDSLDPLPLLPEGSFALYTSDAKSLRFHKTVGKISTANANENVIVINRKDKQQTIFGWGGAFTDSTGINLLELKNENTRKYLLESYFDKSGNEYNFGRVPIGGTDFSTHGYSYADSGEDKELKNFNLTQEDYLYKIPFIHQAKNLRNDLKLLASAWTAPKWMKSNGEYTGGRIKDGYFSVWAKYYFKFFEAYFKEGISFWGVTTGNEPSLALVNSKINSVLFTPNDMREWISEHLGPTIKNSEFQHLKILTLDDQRFFLPWWPALVIRDKVTQYVDGLALHWYWDFVPPALIDLTQQQFPNLFIFATESCRGSKFWEAPVSLGDWSRAEDYAHGIIEDLNHHVVGWIDWNMALDLAGGPCYIGNEVDSTIIVNKNSEEFYKQPTFYIMGHFSKFIPENSIRITHSYSESLFSNLEIVAFERPDKAIVVILHNRKDSLQNITVRDPLKGDIEIILNPKSINSLIYW